MRFVLLFLLLVLPLVSCVNLNGLYKLLLKRIQFDEQKCRSGVVSGRKILEKTAEGVVDRFFVNREERLTKLAAKHLQLHAKSVDELVLKVYEPGKPRDGQQCSPLTPTLLPPYVEPTTVTSEASTSPESTISDGQTTTEQTGSSTTTEGLDETESTTSDESTTPPTPESTLKPVFDRYTAHPALEWSAKLLKGFDDALNEEALCGGMDGVQSIAALQKQHYFGALASFATNDARFLCPICHTHVSYFHRNILLSRKRSLPGDDQRLIVDALLAWLPEPEVLCSSLLPACHEDYDDAVVFESAATTCLKCSLCNTVSVTVLQKAILDEEFIAKIRQTLNHTIFNDVCSEICSLDQPANATFNYGDEAACQKFLNEEFDWLLNLLTTFVTPNNLCTTVLGYCEQNATPNILDCVRDACDHLLSHPLNLACELIPGDLSSGSGGSADAFFDGIRKSLEPRKDEL